MNDELFERASKYSHLDTVAFNNYRFAMHYGRAFELLYSLDEPIDTISLPMLFLLRHYLELILKYNIKFLSDYSDVRNGLSIINSSHDLSKLEDAFFIHFDKVKEKYKIPNVNRDCIDDIIKFIGGIDTGSYHFRYSHSQNDDINLCDQNGIKVDIYELMEKFKKASKYLNHIEDVLLDYLKK